jgi:hypothetical protein
VLHKTLEAYKLWHVFHQGFPRLSKHTLGEKIDGLFSDLIESLFLAGYSSSNGKAIHITTASVKLDLLKYFVQVAWELKCLDHKQYAVLTPPLVEVGKMIGGWMKHTEHKTPLA